MQVLYRCMDDFRQNSAGYLANHMARLFFHGLQQRIAPLGLAPGQFMVLLDLWEGDRKTQAQLVASLDVEQATMANTLSRMERDGLIERHASPRDKRARIVVLTQKARDMRDDAMAAAQAQNEVALASLDAQERALFADMMRRVIAAMQRG